MTDYITITLAVSLVFAGWRVGRGLDRLAYAFKDVRAIAAIIDKSGALQALQPPPAEQPKPN